MLSKFEETEFNEAKLSQKQIAKNVKSSDSTNKRCRNDTNRKGLHNRNVGRAKKNSQRPNSTP